MATKTANYNLIKPDLTDDADIRVINGNMDVLDNNLKQVAESVTNTNNNAYSDITVTSDYTLKFTKGAGSSTTCDTIKNATEVKNTTGTARITAVTDNNTNVFEVGSDSKYNFNGLTTYMNSNDDYFRFGGNDAYLRLSKNKEFVTNATKTNINGVVCEYNTGTDLFIVGKDGKKFTFNENGDLMVDGDGDGNFDKVLTRQIYYGAWYGGWVYATNDLLIQGGLATVGDTLTNLALPRPYVDKNSYILYVSDNSEAGTLSDWAVSGKRVSNTTIGLRYFSDRQVAWLTIGGRN